MCRCTPVFCASMSHASCAHVNHFISKMFICKHLGWISATVYCVFSRHICRSFLCSLSTYQCVQLCIHPLHTQFTLCMAQVIYLCSKVWQIMDAWHQGACIPVYMDMCCASACKCLQWYFSVFFSLLGASVCNEDVAFFKWGGVVTDAKSNTLA